MSPITTAGDRLDTSKWPDGYPCLVRDDGKVYIRASSLGRCMVGTVGAILGYAPQPPKDQTKRWWHEGRLHEPDIIAQFSNASGFSVERETGKDAERHGIVGPPIQHQVRIEVPNTRFVIIGHIDGLVKDPWAPVEAKSVGEWTWVNKVCTNHKPDIQKWVAEDMPYAMQFGTYVLGTDATEGFYVVKDRNKGRLEWVRMEPPLARDAPIWRAQEIAKWVERGVLPPCDGNCNGFDSEWWHIHEQRGLRRKTQDAPSTVNARVMQYKNLSQRIKEATQRQKEIKNEIRGMVEPGEYVTETGKVRVWGENDPKKIRRFSQDKARELMSEEAAESCMEETEYPDAVDIR